MFRWLARMLAVAGLAPLVLPAYAVANEPLAASGSIAYTWQGDPARGCAAVGVCGVQGALMLQSQGISSSGGPPGSINVAINASGSTVRVAGGPGGGECVDVPASAAAGNLLITRRGGRLIGRIQGALSSGRCAGPRQQDLARILLPVRPFGARHRSFDLHASKSFVAGPFTGTVVSTLVVRPAGGSQSGNFFGGGPPTPVREHKVLLEQVTLRYGLGSVPGAALDATFTGEADPFCAAVASCGATGTLALAFPGLRRTLVIQASRVVRSRVGARQALGDLRRGRLHVGGGGFAPSITGVAARVTETFTGSDGSRCQDASSSRQVQSFFLPESRSGGGVSLALYDPLDSGVLRTHCPGPTDADVFGNGPELARTSIGVAQLLARHRVISLSRPGSFAGVGYVGARSGALRFSLSLERVRAGTVEVRRP